MTSAGKELTSWLSVCAVFSLYWPRQANLVLIAYASSEGSGGLRIRAVSPEPPLLAHTSSGSRGTFRQKFVMTEC